MEIQNPSLVQSKLERKIEGNGGDELESRGDEADGSKERHGA